MGFAKIVAGAVFVALLLWVAKLASDSWCRRQAPEIVLDESEICTTPDPVVKKLGPPTRESVTTSKAIVASDWDRITFDAPSLERLPDEEMLLLVWEWRCLACKRGQLAVLADKTSRRTLLIGSVSPSAGGYLRVAYPGNRPPDLPCLGWLNPNPAH